jgi:hypothetical protein
MLNASTYGNTIPTALHRRFGFFPFVGTGRSPASGKGNIPATGDDQSTGCITGEHNAGLVIGGDARARGNAAAIHRCSFQKL